MKSFSKIIVVVLLTTLCGMLSNAQTNTDSLHKLLKANPENNGVKLELAYYYLSNQPDSAYYMAHEVYKNSKSSSTEKVTAFKYIGNSFLMKMEYDSAHSYLIKAFKLVSKNGIFEDPYKLEASILSDIGTCLLRLNKMKNSIDTFLLAQEISELITNEKDKLSTQSLIAMNLGQSYNIIGLFDKALEELYKAELTLKETGEPYILAATYNGIANTKRNIQDLPSAINYAHKAVEIDRTTNNKVSLIADFENLCLYFLLSKKYDSAIFYNSEALAVFKGLYGDEDYIPYYQQQATIHKEQGEIEDAILYYQKAIKLSVQYGDSFLNASNNSLLGELFLELKKYSRAKTHYVKALEYFEKENATIELEQVYFQLARIEKEIGNFIQSLNYFEKYDKTSQVLLSEEKQNAIVAQEIKYQTSLKEAQIAQQQTELKANKQRQNWILGGGSIAVLAASGLGLLYRRTRKQKEQIQQQHQRIELLNEDILHNSKNNLNLMTTIFERQSAKTGKVDSAIVSREIAFTLSALQHQLYEKHQPNGNLKQYFETLCKAKEAAFKVPIRLDYQCSECLNLSPRMLQNMGLIFNELSTNAVKYAFEGIAQPLITLTISQPQSKLLKMTLKDNGVGLPPAFDSKHFVDSQGMGLVTDLVAPKGNIKMYNDNGACFEITLPLK